MPSGRRLDLGDTAQNVVLWLFRGSDRRFVVRWKDSLGAIVPISAVDGVIQDDQGSVLMADIGSVSTILPDGTVSVAILGAATAAWPVSEHGSWDFTATSVAGEKRTLVRGSVIVKDP